MANPPLPMIASNTEETAFAVLEGNVILEKVNIAITDMSEKMTTSIGHLAAAFMSFSGMIKEQQAALMAAASLSADGNSGQNEPDRRTTNDKGNLIDNINDKGLFKGAGMSIMASLSGIFTNMMTWMTGIVTTFTKIGKSLLRFGKLGGRLFLPITLIIGAIGAVSESWESFASGDIWGGLEKAVTGFFNSIVTIPLDLIKDGVAWLLSKMGFDEAADVLNSFSFTEEFNKIISKIFGGVKESFKVITDLFSFGEEDKTALGILGKLTDLVYAPVNMAINFVSGIFGWSEEGAEPFKLQDWISTKVDEAITWVKGLFSWAGKSIAAGWTSLTDFLSQKWTDVKTWFTDKLEWVSGAVGEGWTNITDFVSQKWNDITSWFTDKLEWMSGAIGEGWTSLTDFVSQKWEDIKTWFGDKLTMAGDTIGSGVDFISTLVTDAWESVKKWFSDALAGIADALPSWDDITSGIISTLPSWMVPDSYKTPQMRADAIEKKIAQTQADIEENSLMSVGLSSADEKQELAELLAEQSRILAEIAATGNKGTGDTTIVTTTEYNSSGGERSSPSLVIREGQPVGGSSAYLATGRPGF